MRHPERFVPLGEGLTGLYHAPLATQEEMGIPGLNELLGFLDENYISVLVDARENRPREPRGAALREALAACGIAYMWAEELTNGARWSAVARMAGTRRVAVLGFGLGKGGQVF
jgi:hypothetical protein